MRNRLQRAQHRRLRKPTQFEPRQTGTRSWLIHKGKLNIATQRLRPGFAVPGAPAPERAFCGLGYAILRNVSREQNRLSSLNCSRVWRNTPAAQGPHCSQIPVHAPMEETACVKITMSSNTLHQVGYAPHLLLVARLSAGCQVEACRVATRLLTTRAPLFFPRQSLFLVGWVCGAKHRRCVSIFPGDRVVFNGIRHERIAITEGSP